MSTCSRLIAGATDTPALARSGAKVTTEYPPMDPAEVARGRARPPPDGPTWFAGEGNRAGAAFFRTVERADAVAALSAGTDALLPALRAPAVVVAQITGR